MWTTPPCLLHSSMTSSWISPAQLGSSSLKPKSSGGWNHIRTTCDLNKYLSYACGLKRFESWRQWVASGWAGRFRAWLGDGAGTAGWGGRKKKTLLVNVFRNGNGLLELNTHLAALRWLGRTWILSSAEPAGQQEGSSDQFLEGGKVPIYIF